MFEIIDRNINIVGFIGGKNKKKSFWWIIIAVVAVLILTLIIIFLVLFKKRKKDGSNNPKDEISERTSVVTELGSSISINSQGISFSNPLNDDIPEGDPFEQEFEEEP